MFSALRNPCDSPSKVMYAYGMPCAARSAAMDSACAGGTTGSSSPCSSSTGQVAPFTCPTGARSVYSASHSGSGPISPSR